ncbi:olfactory receptor 2AJ1-like [Manis pentadactyla]|uniref:olfactory receptor 2AJ1-like n=1 Tax=Manis pentadactyla TaxID=143292 RepID=UPI00255CA807|nr:olfactory receptor 2AJ1-like [Manis pentadactyla]
MSYAEPFGHKPSEVEELIMGHENHTFSSDFILLGLFTSSQTSLAFYSLIFIVFLMTVAENTVMILLIHRDSHLHTPMYFLLSHLSFMDILHSTNIVPKMLTDFLSDSKTISFAGCGFQIFLSISLLGGECFLLGAMSYDRYVAICHPLRYPILMNEYVIVFLAGGSWIVGTLNSIIHTTYVLHFPFCGSRAIDHFFCEVPAMLKLSCAGLYTDTSVFEYAMYTCCVLMLLVPLSLILNSYSLILAAVLQMHSAEARRKAFGTCSSHLAVVGLFYGAAIFSYMRPKSNRSANHGKVVSTFYTIFTPVLNPLIYNLRTNDVKGALTRLMGQCPALNNN